MTIQAQILDLLSELKQRLGMAILLITHNLGIVGDMADRVAVMYAGQIVELSPGQGIIAPSAASLHPRADEFRAETAWRRRPPLGHSRQRPRALAIFRPAAGLAPRCPIAKPECSEKIPELLEVEPGRFVRCPFWK